jgi:glycosyltransferase involved in cell wall biosynthesis
MSTARVVCNARFAGQELTGVQRYGHELLRRFDGFVEPVAPPAPLSALRGHWWEQAELPELCTGRLLWSPGNTGPLRVRQQVVTIHDASTLDHPEWFARKFAVWYRFLLPHLARRVRRVITVSEFSRERLIEQCALAPDRVVAIPNGVDARFRPAGEGELDVFKTRHDLRQPYLLYVGSWEPRKNLAVLLRAWQYLAAKEVTLVLAGGVGTVFRDRGFDRVPPGVRLWGRIADDDLVPLLAGATGFVFPSLYEGFGLPPLEAMACGCPALVSSSTSLPEVCGHAFDRSKGTGSAVYFNPRDAEQLADRVRELLALDAATRARWIANGLEHTRPFTWDRTAELTRQVLEAELEST